MSETYCKNLNKKNLPILCQKKSWKRNGCTTDFPKDLLKNKSLQDIKKIVTHLSTSKDKNDWNKCFGDSNSLGYGSKISYVDKTHCSNLKKNQIITCKECEKMGNRDEGKWLYIHGHRIKIPNCQEKIS